MHYRYFLQLSYDGSAYNGWQVQDNAPTVQAYVDAALSTLLGEPIQTTGAGRTDTGVHARKFYAHFDSLISPGDMAKKTLAYKMNRMLPRDIAIQDVFPVHQDMHARFSATQRTYNYIICSHKDPFYINRAWIMDRPINLTAMKEAANCLLRHEDFSAFSKSNTQTKTNICKLSQARWHNQDHLLLFEISADRFLRNMVRAITGTLVEVGLGKRSVEDFQQIILSKDRQQAGYSAPACGLYLVDVVYPEGMAIGC